MVTGYISIHGDSENSSPLLASINFILSTSNLHPSKYKPCTRTPFLGLNPTLSLKKF